MRIAPPAVNHRSVAASSNTSPTEYSSRAKFSNEILRRACTHDVDGDAAHRAVGLGRQVLEDVGAVVLQQLERDGQVMVLEHRVIVVHHRQLQPFSTATHRKLNAPTSFPHRQAVHDQYKQVLISS